MLIMRALGLTLAIGLLCPAFAQDKKDQDDIVQNKDGTLYVGKILSVTDTGVEMQLKAGGKVSLDFKNLVGYSVYKVKADRIDPNSAQAHFDLGDWCLANGLFSYAILEFDKAAALDASLTEKAKTNKEKALAEDARTKFEEAKRLIRSEERRVGKECRL